MPFPTSFFIPESPTLPEGEAGESTKHMENSFHLQIQIRMNSKHSHGNSVFSHFVYLQASKEKRGFYSEGSRKLCAYWGKGGISNVFPDHFLRSCGLTLTNQLPCWVVRALSDACFWLWLSAGSLITHQFSEPHMSTSEKQVVPLVQGGRVEGWREPIARIYPTSFVLSDLPLKCCIGGSSTSVLTTTSLCHLETEKINWKLALIYAL